MSKNCVEIISPFVASISDAPVPVQLMGGVGSFALLQPETEIRAEEKLVVLPRDMNLDGIGQYRDDGNLRDADILVLSSDHRTVKNIEELANDMIGNDLEVSVFGLHRLAHWQKQIEHRRLSLALRWLSDRYVEESSGQITNATKALYPFAVDLDRGCLDTWHTVTHRHDPIPGPHPGTVILNYLTRSISGLRPKDENKVQRMAANVFDKEPEILDWIVDGPGQTQLELADALHTLREPDDARQDLIIGGRLYIVAGRPSALSSHPAFVSSGDKETDDSILKWSRRKARLLHVFESDPRIVTSYQRYLEQPLSFVTKNK